jgi:hypothetical protein
VWGRPNRTVFWAGMPDGCGFAEGEGSI